ncbi:SPOR domain-containing protein [Marinoscillum sp.]|uniref:SPOR domain-containing protein n=1 Tax=Marinoscillum sp. TaxID=2024838 RepID=UPI003BABAF24
MRALRFIVLAVITVGVYSCKTSSVTTTSTETYREDLSVLRPEIRSAKVDTVALDSSKVMARNEKIAGHIKMELDSVNQIIIEQNRARRYVDGFTIQVYTGTDRDKANEAVRIVREINPELDPTMRYVQPSYKVKVGQYISKLEAHAIYESLREEFPLALLIPERIPVDYD